MALTQNFKKFAVIVCLTAITAGGYFVGKQHNFWGALDKKEAVALAPTPVEGENLSPTRPSTEIQQDQQAPVQYQPQPVPQSQPQATPPAQHKDALDKLGGMDKL